MTFLLRPATFSLAIAIIFGIFATPAVFAGEALVKNEYLEKAMALDVVQKWHNRDIQKSRALHLIMKELESLNTEALQVFAMHEAALQDPQRGNAAYRDANYEVKLEELRENILIQITAFQLVTNWKKEWDRKLFSEELKAGLAAGLGGQALLLGYLISGEALIGDAFLLLVSLEWDKAINKGQEPITRLGKFVRGILRAHFLLPLLLTKTPRLAIAAVHNTIVKRRFPRTFAQLNGCQHVLEGTNPMPQLPPAELAND